MYRSKVSATVSCKRVCDMTIALKAAVVMVLTSKALFCVFYFFLVSSDPPTITSEGHSSYVSEGNPASVSCPVLGNPYPTITWHKGNETFPSSMINSNNILNFPETVLNDSGWYTCFAENFLGNVTVTVHLRVGKLYGLNVS